MNEAGIVAACKKGDRIAQKALFDTYAKGMLHLCIRYVRDIHDAEELMLNGFCKFFTHIGRFDYNRSNSIGGWLSKIMVNECLMHLRKADPVRLVTEEAAVAIPAATDTLDQLSAADLIRLIDRLPDGYRTVFNLYTVEGYSHKEIAAMLHITEGTSKSQLSKARAILQQSVQEKGLMYER